MHFLTTTILPILLLSISVLAAPHQFHKRSHGPPQPAGVGLKHVTRAELVDRATHPRERVRRMHGQVVIRPYPKSTCKDYISTGMVPYARWTNLDQHGVGETGVLTMGVENRDTCVQMCENNFGEYFILFISVVEISLRNLDCTAVEVWEWKLISSECVSVTYDLATMNCYQITDTGLSDSGLYFHGDADVTTKGTSCDDLSNISKLPMFFPFQPSTSDS